MILFAWLSSTAQNPSISDFLSTKKYKVNLLVDTLTGKVYDIPTMDGIVISGGAIAIAREVPRHDTGYWLFFPSQVIVDKDGMTVGVLEGAYVDPVTSRPLIRRQIDSVLKSLMP